MDTPTNADPERDWIDLAWDWLSVAAGLYLLIRHTYPEPHPVFLPAGLLLLLLGFGRLRQKEWASWGLIGFWLVLAAFMGWLLLHGRTGWLRLASIPVLGWLAWSEWQSIRRRRARRARTMVSLVLLEAEPRTLDPALLPHTVASVWPGDYTPDSTDAACFVAGEHPPFMVRSPLGLFVLHCIPQPYFSDPAALLARTPDLRARQFLDANQAWLSVDWMGGIEPAPAERTVYREIGKLVAALAGEGTLALFHPDSGRYCPWNEPTAQSLAEGAGLDVLDEASEPPVVPVAPEHDKALAAAAAEARRRWPEFVAAFTHRHPEQLFSVKTALTVDGETEHIWVNVDRLESDTIHGRLGNDPVALGTLKCDDPVSLSAEAIEDWIYVLSDKPVGGFSIAAVEAARRRLRDQR